MCADGRAAGVLAAALLVLGLPAAARAQACCVGTGLVTPARLRIFEERAVGIQTRARSVLGAFGEGGSFAASGAGTRELSFQQDLFGAMRFGRRFQAALLIPFVTTNRQAANLSGWGSGVGDVATNVRYDAILAGERGPWPGIALLAGLAVPTGRPPDEATDPLATSATGTGSVEGNIGLGLELVRGHAFVAASGWLAQRSGRTVGGVEQSFALRTTALLATGYTFSSEATVGAFAHAVRQGEARDQMGPIAGSGVALVTAGLATSIPFWDAWRLQASAFTDLPISGLGRNQNVGVGATAALLRFWM
jgi:hypothetical protein